MGDRLVHVGFRADLKRALPDRLYAFDLGPRAEQGRALERSLRNLAAPGQDVVGKVARGVADRGDPIGDIKRQQSLVLGDQRRAAAEVDVHVPEAGDQELAARLDRRLGPPGLGDFGVAPDRDDPVAASRHGLILDEPAVLDIDDRRVTHQDVGLFTRARLGGAEGQGDRSYGQISHEHSQTLGSRHRQCVAHSQIRCTDDIHYDTE